MRAAFILLAFLTIPAMACPSLSGNYKKCHSSTGQGSTATEILIEQKIVNQINEFTITTKEAGESEGHVEIYKADGKTKTVTDVDPDTGMTIQTQTTASCLGNLLNLRMIATVDGKDFANITIKVSKSNNQLTENYSGTSMGDHISDMIICE